MKLNPLKIRILELCYKHKISHVGSFITAVDIIDEIYSKKNPEDIFILSSGHAGLALYVVLEKYVGLDAEQLYLKHGLHPHRDLSDKIFCSTGSLGAGITIAVGAALANKNTRVYVLCSDGESYEGSFWESLSFIDENKINNINIYININGYAAYKRVDRNILIPKLLVFLPPTDKGQRLFIRETNNAEIPFLSGLSAHYKVLTSEDWNLIKNHAIQ